MIEIGWSCGNFSWFKQLMKAIKIIKDNLFIRLEFSIEKNWIVRAEFLGLLQQVQKHLWDFKLTDPSVSE